MAWNDVVAKAKEYAAAEEKKNRVKTDNETVNQFLDYSHEKKARADRVNSNPVFKRYDIDPDNFDMDNFESWANNHGFEKRNLVDPTADSQWYSKKGKFWSTVPSKTEQNDKVVLETLAKNNERKKLSNKDRGIVESAVQGAIDGISFGAIQKGVDTNEKRKYTDAGLNPDKYVSPSQAMSETTRSHPIANVTGNIAGSMASLGVLGKGVGAATQSVKWISNARPWIQNAINSGITFAIADGSETAFDTGDIKKTLINAGSGLVGGAIGGSLSAKVGEIGNKILSNSKYRNKIIAEIARSGVTGATFAAGKLTPTLLYPKEYRPTGKQIAAELGSAFAFAAMSSAIGAVKTSGQNKKLLDELYQKMSVDYENMARSSSTVNSDGSVTTNVTNLADNVLKYTDAMENYLNGKGFEIKVVKYSGESGLSTNSASGNNTPVTETITQAANARFVGQDKYVKTILSELNTIRNNVMTTLNEYNAKVSNTSSNASAAETNVAKQNIVPNVEFAENTGTKTTHDNANISPISENLTVKQAADTVKTTPNVDNLTQAAGNMPEMSGQSMTNIPNAKEHVSSELEDLAQTVEKIERYVPSTAGEEIKRAEDKLISMGADDVSRKKVITTAVKLSNDIIGTNETLTNILNRTVKATKEAVTALKNTVGVSDAYWNLFSDNFYAVTLPDEQAKSVLMSTYSNAFVSALKNNNPKTYESTFVTEAGADISGNLPGSILNSTVPDAVRDVTMYKSAANEVYSIASIALKDISDIHSSIYSTDKGQNEITSNENVTNHVNELNLKKVGDFCEIYGEGAEAAANAIGAVPTYKTVDGKRTLVVGFPFKYIDDYAKRLAAFNLNIDTGDGKIIPLLARDDAEMPKIEDYEPKFIDNRDIENVGKRNVKAFQYEHPQIRPFYSAIANELLNDLSNTIKGERIQIPDDSKAHGDWTGVKRFTSPAIAEIKDTLNVTYDNIHDALERIINDNGQENYALAKKIELVIDDMLTNGYKDFEGREIPQNMEYIKAKSEIKGTDGSEYIHNENVDLPIPETEDNSIKKDDVSSDEKSETKYNHLYDENKVSKAYLDSVNPEIENAVISIRNGDIDGIPNVIHVTELNEKTIKAISELVGFDVSGYVCKIEKDAIMHIEKRHGINGNHDHSLSDPKDVARIGYVINNSDSISWIKENDGSVKTSKKYRGKNNQPAKLIMMQKKIDGTYCVSDVVPDSKNKAVWITAARIQKKHQDLNDVTTPLKTTSDNALNASDAAVGSQVPHDSNAIPQLQTSETPHVSSSASTNSVTRDKGNVKDSNEAGRTMYDLMEELDLNYDEQRAILEYKSSGSYKINDKLRQIEELSEADKKFVDELNAALDKFPLFKGKVYRQIGFMSKNEFDNFISENSNKFVIKEEPFISASKTADGYAVDKEFKVFYEIACLDGKDVSEIGITEENEVLFKSGSRFAIKSFEIKNKEVKILCEELTESGKELQTSIDEAGDREKGNGYAENQNLIGSGNEHAQKVDSVRERSRGFHEIHDTQSASKRGNVDRRDVSDSLELRKDNRNVAGTSGVLERNNVNDKIKEKSQKDGADNDESQSGVLERKSESDGRGLRSGAGRTDVEEGTQGIHGSNREESGQGLPDAAGDAGSRSDVRDDSQGIHRADDGDNAGTQIERTERRTRGTGRLDGLQSGGNRTVQGVHRESESLTDDINDAELETIDTEAKTVEKPRPISNKDNFVITNDIAEQLDSDLPNAQDNIKAMELLLTLESESRVATPEEKRVLAKYKGWGGIDIRNMPYDLSRKFDKLYDYEQRRAMQSSQSNAFFTPTKVIDAMYKGLLTMGFKGGNVLETSMGIGNFFGRMPLNISSKSRLTGVELESYTARIAQYLYPSATVINMPFQDVAIKNGSYDLVIGNVPFGQNKISYGGKKYSLHNYFIISSLDKVRGGGIVAVITSAGTLDSYSIDARAAIMDKADVVACYKLPEKVFSRNARTDVQSDMLILRKRADGEKRRGSSILNTTTTEDGLRINEYFEKHPENVLGTLAKGKNAWGTITTVRDDGTFYQKLENAMKNLPKNMVSGKNSLKPVETIVSLSDKPRYFEKNGKMYADDGAGMATAVSANRQSTVRDYVAVRDAYKEMLDAYDKDFSEEEIRPLRDKLSKLYDKFYKNHGPITGDGKKKIGKKKSKNNTFLEADADYYLVSGLEIYDKKKSEFSKSALFEKDTLRKKKITSVDVASDALVVSLNESGKIDFKRMQELTGKTEEQLADELAGEIVLTPEGDYVLKDIYLSGNIYEKLEAVKNKPQFKKQREMLEKVIPTPKNASEINVKLGANYIEPKYIEQFSREVLNSLLTIRKDVSGRWVIEGVRQSRYGEVVNTKYGCSAFNAVQLLEKILNDSEILATKSVNIGGKKSTSPDPEMTEVARAKADDIRAAFESWIFRDSKRRTEIVNKYNRMYNNYRPLNYKSIADKLSFDSMDKSLKKKLYPHQRNGIARFLFGGNMLFAHGVGTGKTFEMIASVMEAKRMGIINKAAVVVPNNKVVDFKRDIAQAYPNAKVLVIDAAKKKRQTMLGLVNSNDWDIVLIAKTTFTKIPVSRKLQAAYAAQQLENFEIQIAEAENDRTISRRQMKSLITQRDNFEQKLKDLNSDTKRDENSVDFEQLGIDCICADEAHNYKSIMTPTKLDIKGLVNKNNAQMANDMLMKLDYIRSINGRIIFGTGTPITNTVSEIYNMTRMVRPDILESAGIHSLDEWVNTFAKIDTVTEIDIDNQIKKKATQVIRSFVNTSEMVGMFRQFADIVFTKDVVKNLPKAKYIDVKIEGTPELKQIQGEISSVLTNAKSTEKLKAYGQVMAMADVASVDLRMLSGADAECNIFKNYSEAELDYENSRINKMCDIVLDEYKQSNNIRGTQIIFCDKGSGAGKVYKFNLHKDIAKKLAQRGIPGDEIVIIKNQTDAQLEELYDKVNSGEVRVVIGTSQKMAEGLNVQERVVAIHHPTVTYKPSDWEQGNARGVRAGNINDEVRIYRYLQENTFDSHKWQAQDRKSEMINKALRGDYVGEMEDIGADDSGGAGIDAATAMAITSGNPLVREKIDIDKEVARLRTLKQNYMSEIYRYQDSIAKNPETISALERRAENLVNDIDGKNKFADKNNIAIMGKSFEKQSDANNALISVIKTAPKNGKYVKLGTFNGFDIMFSGDTGGMNYSLILKGANEYGIEYTGSGNNIARFSGVLNRLESELDKVRNRIDALKDDLNFARQEIGKPFEKEQELSDAVEKQKDITYRYDHYGEKAESGDKNPAVNEETAVGTNHSDRMTSEVNNTTRWNAERIEKNSNSVSYNNEKLSVKSVTLEEIVDMISDKFDIPISTGKVTDRTAAGIYKDVPETIRTRVANNLPTIAHELGHHLDKKYHLTELKSIDELCEKIPDDYLKQYPIEQRKSEAVAEFVRIYLKNIDEARKLCRGFFEEFTNVFENDKASKKDAKSLDKIADMVNAYLSSDISERYSSVIASTRHRNKRTFDETKRDLYTYWVDGFNPIKEAVDYVKKVTGGDISGKNDAYVLATNSLCAHSVSNFLICDGFRDLNGNLIPGAKSFINSIGKVDDKNLRLFDTYLMHRHSLEWIDPKVDGATKKRVYADETLEDVEEIKRQIAKIEDMHPEFKEAAENIYEFQNNVLKAFVIPAGGMSEDMFDLLNKRYPNYVPFCRTNSGKRGSRAKSTFANQRVPISRAKGSGKMIKSPLESIIINTETMVKFALRNRTMNILADYADNVEGFGQFVEKVPPDMVPHTIDISHKKQKFTDALQQLVNSGEEYFAVSDLFDEMFGDTVSDFTPVANARKHIITVLRNGKAEYYQVHSDALYKAIAEFTPKQLNGYFVVANYVMQFMKNTITGYNLIFATSNSLRDPQTGYMLSDEFNPVSFAVQCAKAFKSIISNDEMYKKYKAMGGGHSSELSANVENISRTLRRVAMKDMGMARRLAYSVLTDPLSVLAAVNDVSENIVRLSEFERTLDKTGDFEQALYNANDITTNWKRHGSGAAAKQANTVVMFNNAAIQGLDKFARTITDENPRKRYMTIIKLLFNALLTGMLLAVYNNKTDKEGYKKLSSYKKNNFYNIAIGDSKFISIPKAREISLLNSLTERIYDYAFGGDKEAFYGFAEYLAMHLIPPMIPDTLNPVDGLFSVLGNTVIGPLTEIGQNKDFKSSPIESDYDKSLPSFKRYDENTSKPAYYLGQTKVARAIDFSPKKIDHLLSSFGIIGTVVKSAFPMNSKERTDLTLGLRNKFITDSNYSTDMLNKIYDNRNKAQENFIFEESGDSGVEYEQNALVAAYTSGMLNSIRSLPDDKQRQGRAYLLKKLMEWDYDSASQKSIKKKLGDKTITDDCIFDNLPGSVIEWTVDKQKYRYQMTPKEYDKYISDYLTVINNARKYYGCSTVEQCEESKVNAKEFMSKYKKTILYNKYFDKAEKVDK